MAERLGDFELLERLVAFASVSHESNRPIAEFVCAYLDDTARAIDRVDSEDGAKTNLVVWFGPEPTDRSGLVLSGHLDVVPAGATGWKSDAYALTERDDRLYGRGTCDMKGFIALAMNVAAQCATEASGSMSAPLALLLTYDEELGSLGAQRLAATWPASTPLPRSVIVGEPTSLAPVRLHKGHMKLRLTLHGRAAHSGSPQLGRNAIEPAGAVVGALAALRRELESERVPSSQWFDEVPFAVLNVARINGGKTINVVPDSCVIDLGVRLLPGMDSHEMVARIERAAGAVAMDVPMELTVINDNPPMLLDPEADICRTMRRLTGRDETVGVSFSSDAGVLQRDLDHCCMLYGPGSIEDAHRPNEYVPIDEMRDARSTIETLVRHTCID